MPSYAINVPQSSAQPIWYGSPDNPTPVTIANTSQTTANLWIGETNSVGPNNPNNSTKISPGGYVSYDGSQEVYYVVADGAGATAQILPGVSSFFLPANLANLGGISVFNQVLQPPVTAPPNSLWFTTAASVVPNALFQLINGVWIQQQFDGASLIEVNTIIASLIAAGTIIAGIVDGTTINAGTFVGSVFEGTDFVINSLGAFFYSGIPALGNLIASITSAAGANDGLGNPFFAGFTIYDGNANVQFHINPTYPAPAIELPTGVVSELDHPAIYSLPTNVGGVNESEELFIQGPGSTFDGKSAQIVLVNSAKDGSVLGTGLLLYNGFVNAKWSDLSFQVVSPSGIAWNAGGAQTDTTARTVTPNNTQTQMSGLWTINGDDAKPGTVYKITCLGAGTQVAGGNNWIFYVNGFNNISEAPAIGAAGNIFVGGVALTFEGWIQILTLGTNGKANFFTRVTIGPNNSPTTDANSLTLSGRTLNVTVDTTNPYGFSLTGAINGVVAGANFSGQSSYAERIGR